MISFRHYPAVKSDWTPRLIGKLALWAFILAAAAGLLNFASFAAAAPVAVGFQGQSGEHGHGNSGEHGRGHEKNMHAQGQAHGAHSLNFTARDRDAILAYFRGGPSTLPPGLAKRGGNLPPGLEKHLERDGQLPPGLQKRFMPLPAGLERLLPPCPAGYRRGILGQDVLILNNRTGRIADILRGVINR